MITHLPNKTSYYISLLHLSKLYRACYTSQIEDTFLLHQISESSSFRRRKKLFQMNINVTVCLGQDSMNRNHIVSGEKIFLSKKQKRVCVPAI